MRLRQMVEQPMKGRSAGRRCNVEKNGSSGCVFECLALEMLLNLWPPDMVTTGLAVCRFLRQQLVKAPRVTMSTKSSFDPEHTLLTNTLRRFEGRLELRYRMGPAAFPQLAHALKDANGSKWCGMVHLDCSGQRIGPAGALDLADAVASSSHLESLRLRGCELHDAEGLHGVKAMGMQMLLQSLGRGCRNLTALDLADNRLTCLDLGLHSCRLPRSRNNVQILELCARLRSLDLSNNNLGHVGGLILAHSTASGASVEHLDLSQNDISERDVVCVRPCSDLGSPPSALTHLDVSSNSIGCALLCLLVLAILATLSVAFGDEAMLAAPAPSSRQLKQLSARCLLSQAAPISSA